MTRPLVVGIGEILWDLLPGGKQLGGAPGNVVTHARSLGAEGVLITRVGRDALGDEAAARLEEAGIPAGTVQRDPAAPTGSAAVSVDRDGQPHFTLAADVAWDNIAVDGPARDAAARADAVVFGTLAQRAPGSRSAIRALVGSCRPGALRILDVNLRDPFWTPEILLTSLGTADVLKVNDQELERCAGILSLPVGLRERVEHLCRRFRLQVVAVTRGAGGSLLYSQGRWADHPGVKVTVKDAVGAGDAFTAALALGLLRGESLDRINRRANEIGAYVCTQPGATPKLPAHLTELSREERT